MARVYVSDIDIRKTVMVVLFANRPLGKMRKESFPPKNPQLGLIAPPKAPKTSPIKKLTDDILYHAPENLSPRRAAQEPRPLNIPSKPLPLFELQRCYAKQNSIADSLEFLPPPILIAIIFGGIRYSHRSLWRNSQKDELKFNSGTIEMVYSDNSRRNARPFYWAANSGANRYGKDYCKHTNFTYGRGTISNTDRIPRTRYTD